MPMIKPDLRFIMSNDETLESLIKGTARNRIKQNFCCLKQFLVNCNIDELIETSYQDKLIDYAMYNTMKDLRGSVLQVEGILKRASEADEDKCWNFLNLLANVTGFNLRTLLKPEKTISEESKQRFKNVTKSCLQEHTEYIKDQLEIKKTLDIMLEYNVITVRDHDDIQAAKGRRKKVETFINCVFGKAQVDWIPKFLYVLDHEGYSNLADQLTRTRPISPIQDLYIPHGQTRRLTARVRALPENTERHLLENDGVLVDAAVQSVFSSPLLNLREGSIYLLLNISKDKSFEMRHTATKTMTSLVRKMLQSEKLKDSITEKTFVLVEIEETDEDAFLNETFDEELVLTSVGPQYEKECSRCIQKTIIDNYDFILDEIETDAITETLNKAEIVPDFIRHKCIDNMGSISRTQRVGIFLQYVLTRESMLKTFMHVLVNQEIDVERKMCSECSGIHVKHSFGDKQKKRTFQFQIEKDEYGEIIVQFKDTFHEPGEHGKVELGHGKAEEHAPIEVTVVAAIDIGTSYSGYAYSTVKAYQTDHLDITCNQSWSSGGKQLISSKTPSCILMTKGKELVSFGYDAEKEYENIIAEGNEESYYFFDKFKMALHKTKLEPEQIEIRDVHDHAVAAIDVFALAIKALKEDLEQHLIERIEFSREKIRWVLTVPGLRDFNAEEFMKICAEKVGIRREQLTIAMEPEAASIFYLYKSMREKPKMDNKYMVIDVGGGTFDVSVHEVLNENHLRQLCSPSGGPYGGTTANKHFLKILTEIVGPDVMKSLKTEHSGSYLELMREFDCAKRVKLSKHNRKTINFTFPITIFNRLCNRYYHRHFQQMIKESKHKNNISIVGDKLRIAKETMYSFFVTSVQQIVKEIDTVLRIVDGEVKNILLVGGFAESEILQDKIRKSFPEKVLVVFEESDLIVLKGAVLFGHQQHIIDRII
ncbi:uncharacterized protein LOC127710591 isoform X1 [Mytilus californianus]|uniref:uncharacterized protein LOC127710591 isoform X1 n=2 Tax=Mytilus californianus TaxID=6549 RepID=UPI002247D396|nr:uncharacterized protein LOC127710591 isoform X1 [Mytilus californianus]